jgi:hypothetical protein
MEAVVTPARDEPLGLLDVTFRKRGETAAGAVTRPGRGRRNAGRPLVHAPAPRNAAGDLAGELRGFLETVLPAPMQPSRFLILEAMPRTPNGKLDRKALPDPGHAPASAVGTFVDPRNPLEAVVAGIWSEILGLDRIGVTDNFFELGGHSLLATQVASRVRDSLQLQMPLRVFFEAATVEALAREILRHEAVPGRSEKIATVLRKIEAMSEGEVVAALKGRTGGGERVS